MTPNDTQRHFSGPNLGLLGLLGLFGARNCATQPVRTVPKHPSDVVSSASDKAISGRTHRPLPRPGGSNRRETRSRAVTCFASSAGA